MYFTRIFFLSLLVPLQCAKALCGNTFLFFKRHSFATGTGLLPGSLSPTLGMPPPIGKAAPPVGSLPADNEAAQGGEASPEFTTPESSLADDEEEGDLKLASKAAQCAHAIKLPRPAAGGAFSAAASSSVT